MNQIDNLERIEVIYTIVYNDDSCIPISVFISNDKKFDDKKELFKIALSNHKNVKKVNVNVCKHEM